MYQGLWSCPAPSVSYPHGDADGTVHVALVQPAVLGDASLLGAQRGRVLQENQYSETNGEQRNTMRQHILQLLDQVNWL